MKFKRLFPFFVTLIIILSMFTACDSSNYKKAVKLMNSGNYEEAKAIFTELGDYKDSADLIYDCNWDIVLDYYKNTSRKFTESGTTFEIKTTSDRKGLNVISYLQIDNIDLKVNYIIEKENVNNVAVNCDLSMDLSIGINAKLNGKTFVNLNQYGISDKLDWNIEGLLLTDELREQAAPMLDMFFKNTYLAFELDLKESELGVTFNDLGIG